MLGVHKKRAVSIEEAIIDLYLKIKIRKNDEVNGSSNTPQIDKYSPAQYEKEKERLKALSPLVVLEYIHSTIDILLNQKLGHPEPVLENNVTPAENSDVLVSDYETLIQKLEAEVRNHIRVEDCLK